MDFDFELPVKAKINKFFPKNALFENVDLTKKQKDIVTDVIKKMYVKYMLEEKSTGIGAGHNVEGIVIIEVELKKDFNLKELTKLFDKSIPYPVLLCFILNDSFRFMMKLKYYKEAEIYYSAEWNDVPDFNFSGISLEWVYRNILTSFFLPEVLEKKSKDDRLSFEQLLDLDLQIRELKTELEKKDSKILKERQMNRKVELNKIRISKQKMLEKIIN